MIEINKECLRELQADEEAERFFGLRRITKRDFFNTFVDVPLAITNNTDKVTFHTRESIERRLSL
ncbi:hypothetical protein [Alkalibacillus almallahensis]|uniref:hypothetical protein n=1 Tax=Alkalibacillus almallahensis TaxID=1379154 RepID=UPI001421A448|nr:hypothetical protein [Alkalibacillus almallahensis]